MLRMLAGISRTWSKLTYPRFVIQATNIINPDRVVDIDNNFSRKESVYGYLSPKPIDRGVRLHENARLVEDVLGRPDARAINFCDSARRYWNEQIEHATAQIYRIRVKFEVPRYTKPRSFRTSRRIHADDSTIEVLYDFLRIIRGKGDVEQIQQHNNAGIGGLQAANDRVLAALNTRAVDRTIQEILQENQRIQYGP